MKKKTLIFALILLLISVSCIVCLKAVKADNNIAINTSYYSENPQDINGVTTPSGYVCDVVNVTITNNGYNSFSTDPTYFTAFVTVNNNLNLIYSYYFQATDAFNNWKTETLNNGDTYTAP